MNELHLIFRVADVDYALAVASVLQMESFTGATPVPGALPHVEGIVTVRGKVMPVIDLRALFGRESIALGLDSRIIVAISKERVVALHVDVAREVLMLDPSTFQPAPDVAGQQAHAFIKGVVLQGARLLLLLDLAKVLGQEEELHDHYEQGLLEDGRLAQPRALPG